MYFNLARHAFGDVQKILFPKYFSLNSLLSAITLIQFGKMHVAAEMWDVHTYLQVQVRTLYTRTWGHGNSSVYAVIAVRHGGGKGNIREARFMSKSMTSNSRRMKSSSSRLPPLAATMYPILVRLEVRPSCRRYRWWPRLGQVKIRGMSPPNRYARRTSKSNQPCRPKKHVLRVLVRISHVREIRRVVSSSACNRDTYTDLGVDRHLVLGEKL